MSKLTEEEIKSMLVTPKAHKYDLDTLLNYSLIINFDPLKMAVEKLSTESNDLRKNQFAI